MIQTECDRLTQAVLWRRMRQPEPLPQLYIVKVGKNSEIGWAIVSHDWPCQRAVICGGNAGMSYPGEFCGKIEGVQLEFRCTLLEAAPIDLEAIERLDRANRHLANYFGLKVEVWRVESSWNPYPWRFAIVWPDGKERLYVGIPNQCETRKAALLRAYQKCKKISTDGMPKC